MPLLRPIAAWLLLGAGLLAGCASAPVQEMSDARQAVRAAEEAGAAQHAPTLLDAARRSLKDAESHLRSHAYETAREEAEEARSRAVEARRVAEAAKAPATP